MSEILQQNRDLENECHKLREETNQYKGKCSNLQRDLELNQNFMAKANSDSNGSSELMNNYKEKVRQLEKDLEGAMKDKIDQ